MPRMGAQQLLHIPAAVAEVVLAEGIGNEHMLGPEGISILGKALLIGREAVGQVADIGRLGEKSDALIALLLQKSNRFEQNLMVVIGNIRCAWNGAAAVGKNNMNAACDQLADAVLIVLAVDNDDGFRIILHHIDQSALFLFTGIFITQHQDGIVLLICVLHQNAGNTGVEIIVKLGDQQADLPLFLPAHVARSQIRYIVEFADRLTQALDSGLINQYSTVNCTGVYTYYKDYHPRCTRHGHSGNIDVVTAIKWSCNIFFYDVGRRLTSDVYDAYAYKLGLGQRTGVEVNEALGRLTKRTDKNYTSSLDIQAAIGQGNTVVSPIQLATYAATLANNGVRYRTHFVKAILDTNTGEVLSETQPEVMDIIEGNGNTFELVRQGMKQVPSTISGKISSYPIAIACKTGTPQRSETYASGKHYLNAMMIAYLPADDPEIAIGITVEYGGYGARTGDLVVDIANAYFAMKDGTLEVDPYVDPRTVAQEDAAASDTAAQTAPDAANDAQTDTTAAEPQQATAPAGVIEEENNDALLAQ